MVKTCVMKRIIPGILVIFILNGYAQQLDFEVDPNIACIDDTIQIINQTNPDLYTTWYWNFCAANPTDVPEADIVDLPANTFNIPVFIALAKDGDDYFAFVTNHLSSPRPVSRISFGSSMLNPNPEALLLNVAVPSHPEGIQIIKDGNNWYGFVIGGKIEFDVNNSFLTRMNFGPTLSNSSPSPTNLNVAGAGLNFPHDLYMFQDTDGIWYGLTVNIGNMGVNAGPDGSISRFKFANGLSEQPTEAVNLGNLDNVLFDPVSLFPINDQGDWYVFVVDRIAGLVRLDFPEGLTSSPQATLIGDLNGSLYRPRALSMLRYCDNIFGFLVDGEGWPDVNRLVRLDFGSSISQVPTATEISEINELFAFPHSLSDIVMEDDEIFTLITNAGSNEITRVFFPTCEDELPSYSGFSPPTISYSVPGIYTIELTVDIGLPTQASICKEIIVNLPTAQFQKLHDTICNGNQAMIPVYFTGYSPWEFSFTDGTQTWERQNVNVNPYPLFVEPNTTSVFSLISVQDNLCQGVPEGSSAEVFVIPKDNAGFDYSSRAFCKNIGVIEPAFINLEGGTFSVDPPGLDIDPQTGIIMLYPETLVGEYNVTYAVDEVCPNSNTIQLNIQDAIFADFSYSQAGYCQNDPNPAPFPGENSDIGSLSFYPDGLVMDTVSGEINLSESTPGIYWIINEILEAAGCPYEIDSTQVEIYHLPVPEFTSDTVCLGDSTSLFDLSTITEGEIVERIWYYDDVEIGRGFETQFAFPEPPGLHNITLEVVSNTGCITDTVMTAFVKALPEIDLLSNIPAHQISDTVISVCLFESITLDASDPDNPDNIAYLWATGDTTATLTVGAYGIGYEMQYHYVTVIDNITGCMDTKEIYVEFSIAACVGIDDFNPLKGIKLFPNPAFDIVQVQSDESINDLWLGLYNVHGVLIENFYLPQLSSNDPFNIHVSDLPQGLYVLILRNNDVVSSVKLMIAR